MAGRFVLTAQLALQNPTSANINSVVNAINNQLRGISATVNVNISPQSQRQLNQVASSMNRVRREAETTTDEVERFGRSAALAIRRFGAFSVATAGFVGLASAIKTAFGEAINFERQFIKISQVTGTSYKDLKGLRDEITLLSTSLGVSSKKISEIGLILAQAGLSAKDTKQALDVLAKTELSATFENIKDTTEGAIAILAQFGGGVQRLEKDLSSINAVSGQFAVESSDLITAVRRTGGAFQAAGGNLNELLALFTSVRATTRESAESIATGFRTIFTRLQRVRTVNFLENLGIQLRDLQGQFVGPYEAIRRLSEALKNIPSTDPRFAQIIEELGGFRQVSKVIPLIQQFAMSEKALGVAQSAGASVAEDAAKAQASLAVQIQKTKEEFDALIRKFSENEGLRSFINGTLQLANALIKVTDALVPLTPLLTTLGTIKLGGVIARFGTGFAQEIGLARGGGRRFAKGGYVPGSGSGDTVPAMLTPGEFVIRKSAAQAFGYDNLAKVNKYANGGLAERLEAGTVTFSKGKTPIGSLSKKDNKATAQFGAVFLRPVDKVEQVFGTTVGGEKYKLNIGSLSQPASKNLEDHLRSSTIAGIANGVQYLGGSLGFNPADVKADPLWRQIGGDNILGRMFEGVLTAAGGIYRNNPSANFDFETGLPANLAGLIKGGSSLVNIPTEVKTTFSNDQVRSVIEKINKAYSFEETQRVKSQRSDFKPDVAIQKRIDKIRGNLARFGSDTIRTSDVKRLGGEDILRQIFGESVSYTNDPKRGLIIKRAKGGSIPGTGSGDTVPALLTPGEFVINKSAASKLGGAALNQINNAHKVQKFALGGAVSAIGSSAGAASTSLGLALALQFVDLGKATNDAVKALSSAAIQFSVLRELTNSFSNLNRITQDYTRTQNNVNRTQQVVTARTQRLNQYRQDATYYQGEALREQSRAQGFDALAGLYPNDPTYITQRNQSRAASIAHEENAARANENVLRERRYLQRSQARETARLAEQERLRIQQRNQNAANIGVAGVSAAAITAGTYFSSRANERISRGEDAIGTSAFGGALSGAGTGAAAGAALGSIIPGVGTALGALIGGAGGGIYGFISSMDEATKELRKVKFDKYLEEFDGSLKAFEEGLIPLTSILPDVQNNIAQFNSRLLIETGSQRETLIGQSRNQAGRLRGVLNAQAKNVRTNTTDPKSISDAADAFIKANRDEVAFIQRFLNIPDAALKKSIESIIVSNNKQIQSSKDLIIQENKEMQRLRFIGAFASALEHSVFKLESFNNTLDNLSSFAGGGVGGSKIVSRNNILSNPDSANNFREFDSLVDSIGRVMGDQGAALAQETKAAARIADLIPSALQKLEDTPGLDAGGSAIEKVIDSIEASFGQKLPDAIKDVLVANLKKQEGGTGADESLIKKIKENLNSVSDDLKKATLRNIDIFKSFNEEAEKQLNTFIDSLDKYRGNVDKIISAQQRTPEISLQQIRFNSEAFDRSVPLGSRFAATQAQFGFIGAGSDDPAALGKTLADAQKKVNELTIKRDGTVDNKERQKLIQEMSKEQLVIQRTTRALEFLADTTKNVAALEEDLAKVRKVREQKFAVAEKFTFGTNADRRRQLLGRVATEAVVRGGNNINVIPQDLRQDVQGYLSSLSELPAQFTDIFGNLVNGTNKDLLRDIIARQVAGPGATDARKQAALAGVTLPGDQEQKLIDAINGQFEKAISANEILVKGLSNNNDKFLKGLDARFDLFLSNQSASSAAKVSKNADLQASEAKAKVDSLNNSGVDYAKLIALTGVGVASEEGKKSLSAVITKINERNKIQSDIGSLINVKTKLTGLGVERKISDGNEFTPGRFYYEREARNTEGKALQEKIRAFNIDDDKNSKSRKGRSISDDFERILSSNNIDSSIRGALIEKFQNQIATGNITDAFLDSIVEELQKSITNNSNRQSNLNADIGQLKRRNNLDFDENRIDEINKLLESLKNFKSWQDLKTQAETLTKTFNDLSSVAAKLASDLAVAEANRNNAQTNVDNIVHEANGGLIYRAKGGGTFKPRGTDTVPAMLTPGEYVVRKEAVDKIGKHNLDKMNYYGVGGFVKTAQLLGLKAVNLKREQRIDEQRQKNIKESTNYIGGLTPAGSGDSRVRGLAQDINGYDLNRQDAAIFMQNELSAAELRKAKQKTKAFSKNALETAQIERGANQNATDIINKRKLTGIDSFGGNTYSKGGSGKFIYNNVGKTYIDNDPNSPNFARSYTYGENGLNYGGIPQVKNTQNLDRRSELYNKAFTASKGKLFQDGGLDKFLSPDDYKEFNSIDINATTNTKSNVKDVIANARARDTASGASFKVNMDNTLKNARERDTAAGAETARKIEEIRARDAGKRANLNIGPKVKGGSLNTLKAPKPASIKQSAPSGAGLNEFSPADYATGKAGRLIDSGNALPVQTPFINADQTTISPYQQNLLNKKKAYQDELLRRKNEYNNRGKNRSGVTANNVNVRQAGLDVAAGGVAAVANAGAAAAGQPAQVNNDYIAKLEAVAKSLEKLNGLTVTHKVTIEGTLAVTGVEQSAKLLADLLSREVVEKALTMLKIDYSDAAGGPQLTKTTTNTSGGKNAS